MRGLEAMLNKRPSVNPVSLSDSLLDIENDSDEIQEGMCTSLYCRHKHANKTSG